MSIVENFKKLMDNISKQEKIYVDNAVLTQCVPTTGLIFQTIGESYTSFWRLIENHFDNIEEYKDIECKEKPEGRAIWRFHPHI